MGGDGSQRHAQVKPGARRTTETQNQEQKQDLNHRDHREHRDQRKAEDRTEQNKAGRV
jgi:hypothetical protein